MKISIYTSFESFALACIFLLINLNLNGQISAEIGHANLPSSNNGYIYVVVDYGIPPYEFTWGNGSSGNPLDELAPGTYCVTVSDGFCCTVNECFVVSECPEITIGSVVTPASGPFAMEY